VRTLGSGTFGRALLMRRRLPRPGAPAGSLCVLKESAVKATALHEIACLRKLAPARAPSPAPKSAGPEVEVAHYVVRLWAHFLEEIAGIEVQGRCNRAVAIEPLEAPGALRRRHRGRV
jgi:hypothetical protein